MHCSRAAVSSEISCFIHVKMSPPHSAPLPPILGSLHISPLVAHRDPPSVTRGSSQLQSLRLAPSLLSCLVLSLLLCVRERGLHKHDLLSCPFHSLGFHIQPLPETRW